MAFLTTETFDDYNIDDENIISKNNLTLCRPDYFQACWCPFNSTTPIKCPYLLRHVQSYSNSSYFCTYHIIRKNIECFNSSYITPKNSVSDIYIYLTIILFIIGLVGNGISIIILLSTKLRHLSVYKNLTILCILNILYLVSILIRHKNYYEQDLRYISNEFCRLHTFIVAFIGHLCSWQLVSTSIQRVYALLSLQSHRTTSWVRIWSIFFICIILPLLLFDGQLFFHYGLLKEKHVCNAISNNDEIKKLRRALQYPMDISKLSNNISLKYHTTWMPKQSSNTSKTYVCLVWNVIDTFIYAVIPFVIILICSFIIIVKVCQRRRSTVTLGGICHRNRVLIISPQDHLSTLLITTNILFFLMTAPLNIGLTIQSIMTCFYLSSSSSSIQLFLSVNEYLRLLQNSYHALSFLFYCVIGNKFRNSAKSICRTMYLKFLECGISDRCTQAPLVPCCLDRRRSSSSAQTVSTHLRSSENRRLTIEQQQQQQQRNSVQMQVFRRNTHVTFDIEQKLIVHSL